MQASKIALIAVAVALIAAFFAFDLGPYFRLEYFKSQQAAMDLFYRANPLLTALAFFTLYVVVTAVSLPVAGIMTLAAGAIFGLAWGTLIVSFASSLGATLAFLASRFLFRDWIRRKFGDKLGAIDDGVKKEGGFYLFTLRLVPAFPFVVVNLALGLTSMKVRTFYWVSQLGMLAGTVVYVNAGTQIAGIDAPGAILSAELIGSFVLLGIFPLIAKRIVDMIKARKVYAQWTKPSRFDRNLVVIGAGSAGLVTAYIAAAVKAKVTLIEKHKMGGDCLNTGCVPSKALIRSAKFISQVKRAHELGIRSASATFDFAEVMERVQRVVKTVEPHDSVARYTELGVECIAGEAKITTPWCRGKNPERHADADRAGHRHRRRRASLRAADSGNRAGRLLHLRRCLEPARAAAPSAGTGRRPDRVGTHPVFRALRFARDPGRDVAADHDARGCGNLRPGDAALPRRRHQRAG